MSPRTKEAYQTMRDERKEQILLAALKIFASQGFSAAKITDIAATAGVSYGLVDHYFGRKEEIYAAVILKGYQCAVDLFERALTIPGSPWGRLLFICQELLSRIRELPDSPDYILLINQGKTNQLIPVETRAQFRADEKRCLDIQVELIRQGQTIGEVVDGDPYELVITFNAIIQGLGDRWSDADSREDLRQHFPRPETVLRFLKA
jgi:AcrR family transcriptional regulator